MKQGGLNSIRGQGALYFGLFTVVLIFLVSIPIFLYGQDLIQNTVASDLLAVSLEKKEQIMAWFDESISDLENLASIYSVVIFVERANVSAPEEQNGLYQQAIDQISGWAGEDRFFSTLFLIDAETGQIMASTQAEDVGKFREDQSFFQEGLTGAYIQAPAYSMETGTAQILAGAPVRDSSGQTIAVLAAQLNLARITEITQRHIFSRETGDAFLLNQANLPITQPRFIASDAVMQRGIFTEAANLCVSGHTGSTLADDYRGVPSIISYTWLPGYGICLINKIDQYEAYQPIIKYGMLMAVLTVIALGVGFLISTVFTRRVALPITRLAAAAEKIGDGDLNTRVIVEKPYEVAVTAGAFNQMAAALQQRMDDLSAMFGIVEVLSGELDERHLLNHLIHRLKQIVGVDAVLWSVYDPKKKDLTITVHTGISEEVLRRVKAAMSDESRSGATLLNGKPQVLNTVDSIQGGLKDILQKEGIRSIAAIPVITGAHVWGALRIGSYQKDYFTQERVDLMMAVGRHLALALERISLYKTSQENEERFKLSLIHI